MKKLFIIGWVFVSSSKLVWSQVDTIRTPSSFKIVHKNSDEKKLNISEEDTLIATPYSAMIVKKKDYHLKKSAMEREILIEEGDSVIATPSFRKILRKKEPASEN